MRADPTWPSSMLPRRVWSPGSPSSSLLRTIVMASSYRKPRSPGFPPMITVPRMGTYQERMFIASSTLNTGVPSAISTISRRVDCWCNLPICLPTSIFASRASGSGKLIRASPRSPSLIVLTARRRWHKGSLVGGHTSSSWGMGGPATGTVKANHRVWCRVSRYRVVGPLRRTLASKTRNEGANPSGSTKEHEKKGLDSVRGSI